MSWKDNIFFTHQPVLEFFVKQSDGPVLELGSGDGSTVMLHELCHKSNRRLVTVDNDPSWLQRYLYLQDDLHSFIQLPDKTGADGWIDALKLNGIHDQEWGVVFIDQSPWEARTASMQLLKNKAKFVVIHDADYFPEQKKFGTVISHISKNSPGIYNFDDVFLKAKMYYPPIPWCSESGPPTLVGTMRADVNIPSKVPCGQFFQGY